jgi:glycosyltransferase involved in cell wall biosynthesis
MLNSITLPDNLQVHHIPFGVNLEKFTLRQDITPNNRIAFVANLWSGKGLDLLWQLIALMPEYHFYICGRWGMSSLEERWHKRYIGQFLEPCGNWTHVERVPDMNEWLDDKTFTLICSKKEAFSYAAAEGMAKGLMPVIHDFYGASNIWPGRFRWRTVVGAAKMIRSRTYEPVEYRQYIGETYPLPKMLRAMDELLEG